MCIKHDGAGAVSRSFAFVCACGRRLFFSLIRVKDAQPVGAKAAAGKDARAGRRVEDLRPRRRRPLMMSFR